MTPHDQSVSCANQMFAAVRQLAIVLAQVKDLTNSYQQLNMGSIFAAMPTCVLNQDGSLGAADATPVAGNPINTSIVSQLQVALSSYDVGVMVNFLQAYADLLDGATVPQQQYAPSVLAKANAS